MYQKSTGEEVGGYRVWYAIPTGHSSTRALHYAINISFLDCTSMYMRVLYVLRYCVAVRNSFMKH